MEHDELVGLVEVDHPSRTAAIDEFGVEAPVDPVREITELIEAQRGYELNAKVISASDQMLGATTQVR